METILGTSLAVFIVLTVIIFGFAAYMTGHGLAATWRPWWQALPYAVLLGLANRFFIFALFEGHLFSLPGFLVGTAVLLAICLIAFRMTRVRQMVRQYPWLFEAVSPFSWRKKA